MERQCDELLGKVRATAAALRDACDTIEALRGRVVGIREALATELNAELNGVQLKYCDLANRDARTRFQDRHGAEGAQLIGYLQGLGRPEAYQNLRILFDRLASLDRAQDKWDVDKALWDVRFVELLDVLDDDDVEIALAVGKAGYVPIQNLSGRPAIGSGLSVAAAKLERTAGHRSARGQSGQSVHRRHHRARSAAKKTRPAGPGDITQCQSGSAHRRGSDRSCRR